jgi:hypothetical protein
VGEEGERRPATSLDPCDEVCALGHTAVELALDPAGGEVVAKKLGSPRLITRRIDRVEPEELLQELGCLFSEP